MQKSRLWAAALVSAVMFLSSATTWSAGPPWKRSIDQLPMYGGVNRRADPGTRESDDRFIAQATREFGTRRKASDIFVEEGIREVQAGDPRNGMRRFNQAWLLDPKNPGVFHGFSLSLFEQGRSCDALEMAEMALNHELSKPVHLADAGYFYAACAASEDTVDSSIRARYIARSRELLTKANSLAPGNDYIYGQWGKALYFIGDYREAWDKLRRQRELGGTPSARALNMLREKLPEP